MADMEQREKITMQINLEKIECRPGYAARTFSTCDYFFENKYLFHERTYFPAFAVLMARKLLRPTPAQRWAASQGSLSDVEQWFDRTFTLTEAKALCERYPGMKWRKEYYTEENEDAYFVYFQDTDKALTFVQTEDFDKLCKSLTYETNK